MSTTAKPALINQPTRPVETTGRYLVLLDEQAVAEGLNLLKQRAGVQVASTADFAMGALTLDKLAPADSLLLDRLSIAVVSGEPGRFQALAAAGLEKSPILAIEPDRVVYAIQEGAAQPSRTPGAAMSAEYLRGYRDAVDRLVENLVTDGHLRQPVTDDEIGAAQAQAQATWGLQATGVVNSRFGGSRIKVAVLDTGLDLQHPDFAGRNIVRHSFVTGEPAQDGLGHGTHCIGTACGPQQPPVLPRYGIAYSADIFVGKVMNNQGSGSDREILAGINWAVANHCAIVSMSLGALVLPGQSFSAVYENAARRALASGTLIVAAAGNDSRRHSGIINPVSHPANCPSIMAVGAVDSQMQIADFSNRGVDLNGGQVDIVGPGVDVYSTWPFPTRYRTISGTSMATPHVAGIAALYAEVDPSARGLGLWSRLTQTARRLILPSVDVGAGLVQAP